MISVKLEYYVEDKEGRVFRALDDIAKDVEHEINMSPLFAEAGYYKITVGNDKGQSVFIEYQKTPK